MLPHQHLERQHTHGPNVPGWTAVGALGVFGRQVLECANHLDFFLAVDGKGVALFMFLGDIFGSESGFVLCVLLF